tara:strand:+ start:223 stop:453 length:231 start_codon:yes stop_codon:yes gene_type:complete
MTFRFEEPTARFEEPTALDKHFAVVAKARKSLAAAGAAGLRAQVALDNARLRFNRAADVLRAEAQPIEYDFNDVIG